MGSYQKNSFLNKKTASLSLATNSVASVSLRLFAKQKYRSEKRSRGRPGTCAEFAARKVCVYCQDIFFRIETVLFAKKNFCARTCDAVSKKICSKIFLETTFFYSTGSLLIVISLFFASSSINFMILLRESRTLLSGTDPWYSKSSFSCAARFGLILLKNFS